MSIRVRRPQSAIGSARRIISILPFKGVYTAWDINDQLFGPYKSFKEAAQAAECFDIGDVTTTLAILDLR